MEEVWKTIEQFPKYDISNKRRVRNIRSGRILADGTKNRVIVSLYGRAFTLYIEKLMEEYFPSYEQMFEVWRTIPEFWGYEVSSEGRVRNRRTGRQQKVEFSPTGRAYVTLRDAGYQSRRPVQYLQEIAFERGNLPRF